MPGRWQSHGDSPYSWDVDPGLTSQLTRASLKLLHPFSAASLPWPVPAPCPGRGRRWQYLHACEALAVLKSKFLLVHFSPRRQGRCQQGFHRLSIWLTPILQQRCQVTWGKAFQQNDTKGKNEPTCFGKSCWQFPAEVVEGGIKVGLVVPAVCASFLHAIKFRPVVVLQSPCYWGSIWLQKDAPARSPFSGWGGVVV